jgi:hypothetical protein
MSSLKIKHILQWANQHPHFDSKFVHSLDDQYHQKGIALTIAQTNALQNIYTKFKIAQWIAERTPEQEKEKEKEQDELMEHYKCSICLHYFVDAVTYRCGDTFCLLCAFPWFAFKSHCPLCRQPHRVCDFVPNRIVNHTLALLIQQQQQNKNREEEEEEQEQQENREERIALSKKFTLALTKQSVQIRHSSLCFYDESSSTWIYFDDM